MYKFIATDMDGTLLNSAHQPPKDLYPTLVALHASQIHFAIASGRQYANLRNRFRTILDKIIIIAENGAIAYQGDTLIYEDLTPGERFIDIYRQAINVPDTYPVVCGKDTAYIETDDPQIVKNIQEYFDQITHVPNLEAILTKTCICKMAIYTPQAEQLVLPQLLPYSTPELKVILSGKEWIDTMPASVNKGKAIHSIIKRYGIEPSETLTFGDYLNDLTMMQGGLIGVAMANAHPQLKHLAKLHALSNDDAGVTQFIHTHVL